MDGGVCEIGIVRTNCNRLPFFLATGVVNVFEVGATIERPTTNSSHAVGDYYRGKAGAIFERTITNSGHAVADYCRGKA